MSFTVSLRHGSDRNCAEFTCPCKNSPLAASIFTAAQVGDLATVNQRLERNPKLSNLLDSYGYSAVHYAAQNGFVSILQSLLTHGAAVDGNSCGATPLHRAAFAGQLQCCELLLRAGAAVNAQDSSFGDLNTPAHKAASQGHMDILDLLVRYGADLSIRNKDNMTYADLLQQYNETQTPTRSENTLISPNPACFVKIEPSNPPIQERLDDISAMSSCPLCRKACLVFVRNKASKQLHLHTTKSTTRKLKIQKNTYFVFL